jgi:hypothetical protein
LKANKKVPSPPKEFFYTPEMQERVKDFSNKKEVIFKRHVFSFLKEFWM